MGLDTISFQLLVLMFQVTHYLSSSPCHSVDKWSLYQRIKESKYALVSAIKIKIKFNPDISLPITFKASFLQGSALVLTVSMPVTHNYSLWAQTAPEKWNQKGHLAWNSAALRSVALGLNRTSQNHFGHLVAGAEFLRWVREVKHFPMQGSLWGRRQAEWFAALCCGIWSGYPEGIGLKAGLMHLAERFRH